VKYLLIDTNIYLFCSFGTRDNYEPELLSRIKALLEQPGVCLLVPEVVELEYRRNVERQAKQYEDSVDAATEAAVAVLRAQADKTAITSQCAQIKRDRRDATKLAQRYFEDILASPNSSRVPIDPSDVSRALAISVAGDKPSKGKTAHERADIGEKEPGYAIEPDCLIVTSVARALKEQGATPGDILLICSDNVKDFGAWGADGTSRTLAPNIAALMPCNSDYFVGLDELLASEHFGLQLTPDERATYAEAAEESRLAAAPPTRRWMLRCVSCGSEREVEAASPPRTCSDCGSPCDAEPSALTEQPERTARTIVCPTCGNQMQVSLTPGRDRAVRRVCLRCFSRLQFDSASGAVIVMGQAEPIPAVSAGRTRGLLVLVCPLCDRHQSSFVRTEDERYFAFCGNPKHGDQLLVYSATDDESGQLALDTND